MCIRDSIIFKTWKEEVRLLSDENKKKVVVDLDKTRFAFEWTERDDIKKPKNNLFNRNIIIIRYDYKVQDSHDNSYV